MITLDKKNLSKIEATHGLSDEELLAESGKISEYLDKIHERDQGFYKVIDDMEVVKGIEDFVSGVEGKFDDIVVLGIGGSALGTICLQQSLKHLYENELAKRNHPRLHVLDNIDPLWLSQLNDIIDYPKTLFIVISKSGGTPETLSEYFYYRKKLEEEELDVKEHFVFITGPEKGLLREISNEEGIKAFDVPENVGGRFSVLTEVGLLPAALIGIDIHELLEGARKMRNFFLSTNFKDNLSFQIAAIEYLLGKKGKVMNVITPYSQRLIKFADWYRQLLAESIGKAVNEKGETINVGLTPINALGVTDQHSQSQLYNEGPNDKFFIFIKVDRHGRELKIPDSKADYLKGVTFNELMETELKGTVQSLTYNNRPNITLSIPLVDAYYIGYLFMLFEGATAFLGEFYGINAFNQPGVELSKKITKDLLTKS